MLGSVAKRLEDAGADFLVICTNTMHKVAFAIEQAVSIPTLHIADATAVDIRDLHAMGSGEKSRAFVPVE